MEIEKSWIHLTDHSFQTLCMEKYGINRGVFNEIDKWFYQQGMVDIVERRREILKFMAFQGTSEKKKIKFGHGGLRQSLLQYVDKVAI
jgi:riboflavin kinase